MDRKSIIILSLFGAVVITGICWVFWNTFSQIPMHVSEGKQIPNKLVCMVNDTFMGIEQIPIEAEGKTYYGCCQMCISKIRDNTNNVRYAIDPYSGGMVNKANAFIVFKPDQKKNVLYFSSEENYNAFLVKPITNNQ